MLRRTFIPGDGDIIARDMNSADDPAAAPAPRYWAFISYSQHDTPWAQWLHGAIERYRVPRALVGRRVGTELIPDRLFPIFRDRDELASAADLGREIREALRVSRNLIVICSPHAAASRWVNEEIRTFKAMGRANRVFCLIVDGEPYASTSDKSESIECLPPALQFHVEADGSLTEQRAEPLAADARTGKDGRSSALLKLMAGILNVRFDELRRREAERARRRRGLQAATALAAVFALLLAYVGIADTDLEVPAGERLRQAIDQCNCSVFRRIPSHEAIAQAASASRARLRKLLMTKLAKENLRIGPKISAWAAGQIAAAFYADTDANPTELKRVTDLVDSAFTNDVLRIEKGRHVGWKDWDVELRPESSLWMLIAISSALSRPDAVDAEERKVLLRYLATTQEIAEQFYSRRDGGWNPYIEYKAEHHATYPATLALHTLLKLHAAGLCWRNDCAVLEQMIKDTSGWLIDNFVDDNGLAGWRPFPDDTQPPMADLNMLVFDALIQAHRDMRVALPAKIRAAAQRSLVELRRRPYLPAQQGITDRAFSVNAQGMQRPIAFPTQVMWYPWSIDALELWLSPTARADLPSNVERALRRSLAHVVISLSTDLAADMMKSTDYAQAETAYGLGQIR